MDEDGFPFQGDPAGGKHLQIPAHKYLAISKHKLMFIYPILLVTMMPVMRTRTKNSRVTPAVFKGALSGCSLAGKCSMREEKLHKTIFHRFTSFRNPQWLQSRLICYNCVLLWHRT